MLHDEGVSMQAKPFSIGVRIEHPQSVIDTAQFGSAAGSSLLGAAEYRLVHHAANGRGVYSFCMCPGGTVVAATSEEGQVVTNGMSQYSRAERNANSGIVVELRPGQDYPDEPLAGVAFQRHWEKQAFVAGGGDYRAPAQRVGDFLAGRASVSLGEVVPSYRPGVTPTDLSTCLPDFVVEALREALPHFDRKLKGYTMEDAVMTGVETRTSSPLRIPRGEAGQSVNTPGLYPAGEGAGYAGGFSPRRWMVSVWPKLWRVISRACRPPLCNIGCCKPALPHPGIRRCGWGVSVRPERLPPVHRNVVAHPHAPSAPPRQCFQAGG